MIGQPAVVAGRRPAPLVGTDVEAELDPGLGAATGVRTWHDELTFSPRRLLIALLLAVLFVPPRRYALFHPLPSSLEPYRLVLLIAVFVCLVGPLVDHRWRRTHFVFGLLPLGYVLASILSVLTNVSSVTSASYLPGAVLSAFAFVLIIFGTFFVVRQLLTSSGVVLSVVRTLVLSGAVLSVLAAVEAKLRENVFDLVLHHLPVVVQLHDASQRIRGGHFRAIASAEQAIPAGVLFATIVPFAVYLLFRDGGTDGRRQWLWLACLLALPLGIAATLSRTAVLMVAIAGALGVMLRWRAMLRLAPLVPVLLVLALVGAPSSLRTFYRFFFPTEGLVAQQTGAEGNFRSTGRLVDLQRGLAADLHQPVFGAGFGTLIVTGPHTNAPITDNAYLDRLTETGAIGLISLLVLYLVPARRLWRLARCDLGPEGDLAAAVSVAVITNGVSIALYGAWAFEQELVVLVTALAIGSWLVSRHGDHATASTLLSIGPMH